MSPAARGAREYPGTQQTRQRLQAEQHYAGQDRETSMKREELQSKENVARIGGEAKQNVADTNQAAQTARNDARIQAQRDIATERQEGLNSRAEDRNEIRRENQRWLQSKAAADIEFEDFQSAGSRRHVDGP